MHSGAWLVAKYVSLSVLIATALRPVLIPSLHEARPPFQGHRARLFPLQGPASELLFGGSITRR